MSIIKHTLPKARLLAAMVCASATLLTVGVAGVTVSPAMADEASAPSALEWPGNDTNAYGGQDYYIDATGGDDTNPGTSQGEAWKTLSKANATTFAPGDRILLKSGETWEDEQLWPQGSGSEGRPITISAYGDSTDKPYIATNGQVAIPFDSGVGGRTPHKDVDTVGTTGAITLRNQEYWEINNVELSNDDDFDTDMTEQNGKIWDGISVSINADLFPDGTSADDTVMDHFRISDVDVHNTDSADKWQSIYAAGVDFQVFGDRACTQYAESGYYFNDVRIENSTFTDVELNAIQFGFNWMGKDGGYTDETGKYHEGWEDYWVRSRDLYSRNVYIGHNYSESIGQGAIQIGHTKDAVVEYNEINGFLKRYTEVSCALYAWASSNITMQYNEVYDGPANEYDGTPWDLEYTNFDVTYQFNYSHGNKAGWMAYMGNSSNSVARYNLSVNDNGVVLKNMLSTNYSPTYITNNVIVYNASEGGHFHDEVLKDTVYFMNNVFYNTSDTPTQWSRKTGALDKAVFSNNDFYEAGGTPSDTQPSDIRGLDVNPKFVGFQGGADTPTGKLNDVAPLFKPASDSPLIDAGRYNEHLGTTDMLGTQVYYGDAPDIGISETARGTLVNHPVDNDPIEQEHNDTRTNLALGATATASSTHGNNGKGGLEADKLVDGLSNTRWAAADDAQYPITLDIDFGADTTFDEVDIEEYTDGETPLRVKDWILYQWDGDDWTQIISGDDGFGTDKKITFPEVTSSKLRVAIESTNGVDEWTPTISEISVYNSATNSQAKPTVTVDNATYNLQGKDDDPDNVPTYSVNLDGDTLSSIRWIGSEGNVLSSLDEGDYTVKGAGDESRVSVAPAFLRDKAVGDYGVQFEFASGATRKAPLTIVDVTPTPDKVGTALSDVSVSEVTDSSAKGDSSLAATGSSLAAFVAVAMALLFLSACLFVLRQDSRYLAKD